METNAVKRIIYDFLKEKVFQTFPKYFDLMENSRDEIFWGRLQNQSYDKIYVSLIDKKIKKIDRRYEEYRSGDIYYYKKRKQLLVTIAVYVVSNTEFTSVSDNLVVDLIEYIESLLTESQATFNYFASNGIVINELGVSEIKDMSSLKTKTQEFRKEFDIPFEYEDIREYEPELGCELSVDINPEV